MPFGLGALSGAICFNAIATSLSRKMLFLHINCWIATSPPIRKVVVVLDNQYPLHLRSSSSSFISDLNPHPPSVTLKPSLSIGEISLRSQALTLHLSDLKPSYATGSRSAIQAAIAIDRNQIFNKRKSIADGWF
ncbi:hypothetical protein SO802_006347 [Lithocarpus litseifolius]|uniref:Uncharacterized protein n=1 Tax=Lithocarpus litseifolius TaxID=425828 RepID=A0AAW2DM89_9ROSI